MNWGMRESWKMLQFVGAVYTGKHTCLRVELGNLFAVHPEGVMTCRE